MEPSGVIAILFASGTAIAVPAALVAVSIGTTSPVSPPVT